MHDLFNMLSVAVFLPLNWMYPWLEKMTYEMAKVGSCSLTLVLTYTHTPSTFFSSSRTASTNLSASTLCVPQ